MARQIHRLCIFGTGINIESQSSDADALIYANYSALWSTSDKVAEISYEVTKDAAGFRLQRLHTEDPACWGKLDESEFLFVLEKDLTIELQKRRPELYFLHAACLSYQGKALLLVARSGGGKSTTCWGLANHGCTYLSDELAPVDLDSLQIEPYPHALNLKTEPSVPYTLPEETIRTDYTLHVPANAIPSGVETSPVSLSNIFHIEHISPDIKPVLEKISAGESASLLYANALNPLSHASDGLDGAVNIARRCQNFHITTGSLDMTITEILSALNDQDRL